MQFQLIPMVIAGGAGLILGYLFGFLFQKKNASKYEEQLVKSKEQLERTKREANTQINSEREKATAAQRDLTNAEAKLAELQKKYDEQAGQDGEVRKYVEELEAAHSKQQAQAEAHWNARQQAEGRCKQAESMAAQAQKMLEQVEMQLRTSQTEASSWKEAVNQKNREIEKLQREGGGGVRRGGGTSDVDVYAGVEPTLENVLKTLMDSEGQRAAVLSDANGITVAAAGDVKLKEGMAATTQMVTSFSKQLEGMVPFTNVQSFHLADTKANVLTGRTFNCAGEIVGLVTYGSRIPSDKVVEGAVVNLSALLE